MGRALLLLLATNQRQDNKRRQQQWTVCVDRRRITSLCMYWAPTMQIGSLFSLASAQCNERLQATTLSITRTRLVNHRHFGFPPPRKSCLGNPQAGTCYLVHSTMEAAWAFWQYKSRWHCPSASNGLALVILEVSMFDMTRCPPPPRIRVAGWMMTGICPARNALHQRKSFPDSHG